MKITATVALGFLLQGPSLPIAAVDACKPDERATLRVRFAAQPARIALLEGGTQAGLRLLDAESGAVLWSAGAAADATLLHAGMQASFGHSFTAVDLDGDGLQDRLYAGDRVGRLWRFDLHADSRPRDWATGGIFADFSEATASRGFVAAPDVALITGNDTQTGAMWFSIALGTAATGPARVSNRLYLLRDKEPFAQWSAAQYQAHSPVTEQDLKQLVPPLPIDAGTHMGYFLDIGAAQVLAKSLTLDGRVHFTMAETVQKLAHPCQGESNTAENVPLSISVVRVEDGATDRDLNTDGRIDQRDHRVTLHREHAPDTGISLRALPADSLHAIPGQCLVGDEPFPHCQLDLRPRLDNWRREDAE